MKAVVLAGGKGSKMFPFSTYHQKCCLPILNTPNIVRIIHQLQEVCITDITIIIQENGHEVRAVLANYQVNFIESTTDTLSLILQEELKGECLVYYGDIVVSQSVLHEIVQNYKNDGNTALVQMHNDEFRTQDYICAQVEENLIKAIYGHPRGRYTNSRMGGIYLFDDTVWSLLRHVKLGFENINCGQMPKLEFYLENVIQKAIDNAVVINATTTETLYDLDFPWDLFAANSFFCQVEIGSREKDEIDSSTIISNSAIIHGKIKTGKNCVIGDHVIIKGNLHLEDNVHIEDGAIIHPNCLIGSNSSISEYCKINANSVIGSSNKIGYHAEFTGVTFDRVAQVHESEVYGVIGVGVDIAAGCVMGILKFDDTYVTQNIKGKRYASPYTNIVCIGDYTRTGIANIFYPGVKVGSNCALGPGLIIDKDIEPGQIILPLQQTTSRSWGSNKYGW